MELRHLRYFVVVAEELHFNRAAERLHIQQPPLSTQIRQLERELGVQLFERTTRSVALTEAGAEFLAQARAILDSVDESVEAARRAANGLAGTLRVGFSGTATYSLLPIIARLVRQELPGAALRTQGELLAAPLTDALLNNRLDVGFGRLHYAQPGLQSQVIRRELLSVMLPEEHPLADRDAIDLHDLADDPFVTTPSRAGSAIFEATIAACKTAGFFPQIIQEASQTATLVSLVAGGFGVALMPESVRHLRVTGAVHRPLASPVTHTELQLIWPTDADAPLLKRFLSIVTERADELAV